MWYAPKWLIFVTFVWIILSIASITLDKSTVTASQQTTLNTLADYKSASYKSAGAENSFAVPSTNFFSTAQKMLTWDYSFFSGDYADMVRWVIFVPITLGILAFIVYSFITLLQGFIP